MDVADVAAAGGGDADARFQAIGKAHLVNVPDCLVQEMAAPNVAIAIDGERGFAGVTLFAGARIALEVPVKIRVDTGQPVDLTWPVIVRFSFKGVDPEVDLWPQNRA